MNEDFVSFELAVKLKEKGFNEFCYKYYQRGVLDSDDCWNRYNRGTADRCSAPTISQVLKWLRKEKKMHIVIDFDNNMCWYFQIALYGTTNYEKESEYKYNSYEQTALEGIKHVLNNLI